MKKFSLLVLLALMCLVSRQANAAVIQIAAPADIYSTVTAAADGDIIELTTSGGAYTLSNYINITTEKSLTIRATAGLAARPIVTFTGAATSYFVRYYPTAGSTIETLTFDGIDFNGNSLPAYFLYVRCPSLTSNLNVVMNSCIVRNLYTTGRAFYYTGTNGTTPAVYGDLTVTNSEFRNIPYSVIYQSTLYTSPNNVSFNNCLFLGPNSYSTYPMIRFGATGQKSIDINHCTFANANNNELYILSGKDSLSIKNTIFAYSTNTLYNNTFGRSTNPVTLGTDCGIYYTAGGTQSLIYPNSTAAKITDPLLDATTKTATASAYKTGSTDGYPIGYYGNQIISSVNSLSGFDITSSTINPSAQQSFTVIANTLTTNLVVTPPTNYEISKTSGTGFTSTAITLTQTSGSVPLTTIYVRLKAGLADNTYTGNISLTSTGAVSKTIAVSGTVTNAPTIYSSLLSLSGFKYAIGGGPSAEQSITVNAVNLTSNLSITAPSNYEISPLSGASFTPISPMSIAQTGGVVSPTTIYVRLKAGLAINSYAQNITLTATGAVTKNIALTGNVTNLPAISNSVTSISGLYSFFDISQSTEQSFTVSGTDLTGDIIVTPPANFEISTTAGANYTSSSTPITLPMVGSGVANTTIYVRIIPGTYLGTKTGNITLATPGTTTKNIALNGKVSYQPVITTPVTTVSGLNYFTNAGPSADQSFTVSGTYLTDNVVITPSTSFEISTTSGTSFVASPSISLTPTSGTLASTTIYVRLKAGLAANTYTENINIAASYATAKTVSVSGTITNKPTITINPTSLSGFGYNLGYGPSTEKTFTVSGIYLSSVILITPPTNYEISTTSGASFAATNPILISQSGGTAAQTTIYVRLKAGLVANAYTGDVVVTSTGATTQNLACSGTILDPQNLTVQIGSGGIVKENNVTLTNGAVLVVNKGNTKTFAFTPDYGYEVSTLTLNNVDVKSQISSNSYTTSAINSASILSVTFKKIQYVLSLKDASTGSIDLLSDFGSTPSFRFTPTTNWKVSTVFYNSVDVTSQLVNGVYTVPALTANGLLNVSFVSTISGAPELVNNKVKVYTNQTDIIIEGTSEGESVGLYTLDGKQIQIVKSQGERIVLSAKRDITYLVQTANKAFKVIL